MSRILTLRVIQGADRGRVYQDLPVPITIGREEGNSVQLNDERVSRFHVKIQEDDGRLVVTDLDSTNGTRVNGHVCNLKILRIGDTISLGRSVLLVSAEESSATERPKPQQGAQESCQDPWLTVPRSDSFRVPGFFPDLPKGLSPGQAAELRELLDHIHAGLRNIVDHGVVDEADGAVTISQELWSQLLKVQSDIAIWIRSIEDPQASQSG